VTLVVTGQVLQPTQASAPDISCIVASSRIQICNSRVDGVTLAKGLDAVSVDQHATGRPAGADDYCAKTPREQNVSGT